MEEQTSAILNASLVDNSNSTAQPMAATVLTSLNRFWLECVLVINSLYTTIVSELERDFDPVVVSLFIAGAVIAVGGICAIVYQCRAWKNFKSQRQFDTSSWLEYNITRSRINKNDSIKYEKNNGRLIDNSWNSSNVNIDDDMSHISSKHCPLDIDQCLLVKSFMKLDANQNCRTEVNKAKKKEDKSCHKTIEKKKLSDKSVKKQNNKKAKKNKKVKSSSGKLLCGRHKPLTSQQILSPYEHSDLFPFYTSASITSSRMSYGSRPSALSLTAEYETQTIELNLTDGDCDSQDGASVAQEKQSPNTFGVKSTISPVKATDAKSSYRRQQIPDRENESSTSTLSSNYYATVKFDSMMDRNISKNPLYNEISEYSRNQQHLGGEDESGYYQRQLTYSTFKPSE